jgi:hypothetical protein
VPAGAELAPQRVASDQLAPDPAPSVAAAADNQGVSPSPSQASTPKYALAAENARVRAASEALRRNQPRAALAQLQRYAAQFPNGALRVEVAALRAIALCAAHAPGSAADSGEFLRAHAGSPLAERVRRACDVP